MNVKYGDIVVISENKYKESSTLWRGKDYYQDPKKGIRYGIVIFVKNNKLIILPMTTANLKKMSEKIIHLRKKLYEYESRLSIDELESLKAKGENEGISFEERILYNSLKELQENTETLKNEIEVLTKEYNNKVDVINKKLRNRQLFLLSDKIVEEYNLDFQIQLTNTFACPINIEDVKRIEKDSKDNFIIRDELDKHLESKPNKFNKQLKYWKNFLI